MSAITTVLLEEEVGILWGIPEAGTLTPVELKRVSKIYPPAPSSWPNEHTLDIL